jgi:hypothetical protein
VAHDVDPIRVAQRADRRAVGGHVLEHELDVRQFVGQQLERVDDGARVVERHQRARAEDDPALREPELRSHRAAFPLGWAEALEVDAPAHQQHALAVPAEVDHRLEEGLGVGHGQHGPVESHAVGHPSG